MSSHNVEPSQDYAVFAEDAAPSPPIASEQLYSEDMTLDEPGKRRWLLTLLGGVLLLGGIGWVLFNRIVLPVLMFSQMKPPPPIAVPLSQPLTTMVEDSSDYAATLDSRQSISVLPKVSGRITAIYVQSGDRVQRGEPLLQVDSDVQQAQVASRRAGVNTAAAEVNASIADVASAKETLQSLQAQQRVAEANVKFNQEEYQRYQDLFNAGATSRQSLSQKLNAIQTAQAQLSQAKADVQAQKAAVLRAQAQVVRNQEAVAQAQADVFTSRVQLQGFTVTAPIAGVVGNIPAKLGDLVTTSTTLLTLSRNEQLEVQLQIPLERSGVLRQGQTVKLLDENGKALRSGQISFISPTVDSATQSVQAKAVFANGDNTLRPSQFVRARVVWSVRPGLLVPTTAISRLGGKDFIFVAAPFRASGCKALAQGQGGGGGAPVKADPNQMVAAQKLIRLGKIIGNNQEVLSGLQASERIVTSGILQLQNCLPIASTSPSQPEP
jgi:multidrug efflux pump subunit AcrA (membrane-fusion protein)